MKKITNDIIMCLLTGIIALLFFIFVFRIWNYNFNVPFTYAGDVVGLLQRIKVFARGETLGSAQSLGTPYGVNLYHSLFDAYVPQLFMFFFVKFTHNIGFSLNLYYILTYMFSSMCTFYLLRKMKISKIASMMCGIIYAFIPGHMLRNEGHLFIGSSFVLPLMVLSMIYLIEGQLCKKEYQEKKQLNLKEVFLSIDKKIIFCIVCFVLTTFSSLYYGIFALFLLTFAVVYIVIDKKQGRHFLYYFILCFTELACIAAIYLPIIISQKLDRGYYPVEIISRVMSDVETYGLKLIQLLLPVRGHRLPFLASITEEYCTTFPLVTENQTSCLGFVMAAGFLISLIIVFFNIVSNKGDKELILCGKINLFIICLAGIGGGASIIAFINYNIRCYNRFSFYIGLFSLIIIAKIFDLLWKKIKEKRGNDKLLSISKGVTAAFILCIAIFDQTTADMAYSEESAKEVETVYYNDKNFVEDIEKYEEKDVSVLVLPTEAGVNTEYGEHFLYLHSAISDWSVGSYPGDQGSRFFDNLKGMDAENIIKIAAVMGYSGIAIYHPGYGEESLKKWRNVLELNLGRAIFKNQNGTWSYYSLKDYFKALKARFTDDEWKMLEDICYNNEFSFSAISGDNLYYTSKDAVSKDNVKIVPPGCIQYGPYKTLSAGDYHVSIKGEELKDATFGCTTEMGQTGIEMLNLKKSKKLVTYDIHLDQDTDNVEFICHNKTRGNIKIEQIQYRKYNLLHGTFLATDLYDTANHSNYDNGFMTVAPGYIQYGPYIDLMEGDYRIQVIGKNLKDADFRCTSDSGQNDIKIEQLSMEDNLATYEIHLERSRKEIEFVCHNTKKTNILIQKIQFCKKTRDGYDDNHDYDKLIDQLLE